MDHTRRNDLLRMTPAEKAIYEAMRQVEKVGNDVLLTDVVVLLDAARHKVADYVDSTHNSTINPA